MVGRSGDFRGGAIKNSFKICSGVDLASHTQDERERLHSEDKIRCVLAHDHVLLRQGVRRLLEDEPDIEVVAEAGTAADALAMVALQYPDVVITDAGTFGCGPDQVEKLIVRESSRSKVLFLAERDENAHDAERRVTRQTSAEQLVERLRKMFPGEKPVVREMPRREREEWGEDKSRTRKRGLTAREREVLELLAAGSTVRSAAKTLGLSIKTVDAHKFNLMRKLGIHNKAELVMWAIQKRIVRLPSNF
jgi:two-component system, NarL family, response regulator NreC